MFATIFRILRSVFLLVVGHRTIGRTRGRASNNDLKRSMARSIIGNRTTSGSHNRSIVRSIAAPDDRSYDQSRNYATDSVGRHMGSDLNPRNISTLYSVSKQSECNNFRGIKLLSHTLKLWERVVENRLKKMVNISERQYGFQPGKSTIQPLFSLRMLQEKHREFGKELHNGVCGPGKGLRQGAKGANLVLAQTKRCSRGLHKHNPIHVCWVQDKRHDQCGKDQRD